MWENASAKRAVTLARVQEPELPAAFGCGTASGRELRPRHRGVVIRNGNLYLLNMRSNYVQNYW